MKFAEKYEILEMVTSGRVSTFLARDRATQEPVVVYTFECPSSGTGGLSTSSIIARLCSLAPNPPGVIVKAGFDEASSAAFITTKMPETAALQQWVRAYHSPSQPATQPRSPAAEETAELSATQVRAVMGQSGSPQNPPPVEDVGEGADAFSLGPATTPPQSGGEFTRLFREANAFAPLESSPPQGATQGKGTAPPAKSPASTNDAIDALFGPAPVIPARSSEPPVVPRPTTPESPSPGSFTQEFMAWSSEVSSPTASKSPVASPAPQPKQPEPFRTPAESSPGSFTQEFMGWSGDKRPKSAVASPAPQSKEPGSFTQEFLGLSQQARESTDAPVGQREPAAPSTMFDSAFGTPSAKPGAASFAPQPESQKNESGEFTSFFRDPMEHPASPDQPIALPDLATAAPRQQQTGEFTRIFGREGSEREEASPLPVAEPEPPQPSPGSFTQLFGDGAPGKASQLGASTLDTRPDFRAPVSQPVAVTPPPPVQPLGGVTLTPTPPPANVFVSRAPVASPTPVSPAADLPLLNRSGPSEATDVFRLPGGEAPPVEDMPSGPSEFTMFLDRGQVRASVPPEPLVSSADGGASGRAPAFAPPPPPQPPPVAWAPPPPLQPPPAAWAPQPPPPQPPAMKYPPLPAPPPPAAAPAPKASMIWPLITVLTILISIGAMLVMYFVMKH
jgi:hypothetical protein